MTLSQKAHGKIIILVRVDVLASVSPINHFVIYAHILIVFPDGMAVFYFNPDKNRIKSARDDGLDFKYTGTGKRKLISSTVHDVWPLLDSHIITREENETSCSYSKTSS